MVKRCFISDWIIKRFVLFKNFSKTCHILSVFRTSTFTGIFVTLIMYLRFKKMFFHYELRMLLISGLWVKSEILLLENWMRKKFEEQQVSIKWPLKNYVKGEDAGEKIFSSITLSFIFIDATSHYFVNFFIIWFLMLANNIQNKIVINFHHFYNITNFGRT